MAVEKPARYIGNEVNSVMKNKEEIDIPEYRYRESDIRGCWISNVVNIDTPKEPLVEVPQDLGITPNINELNTQLLMSAKNADIDNVHEQKLISLLLINMAT